MIIEKSRISRLENIISRAKERLAGKKVEKEIGEALRRLISVGTSVLKKLRKDTKKSTEGIELASHRTMQTCVGSRIKSNLKRGMSRAAAVREAMSYCRSKPAYKG